MQSPMFVFAGMKNEQLTDDLSILQERLNSLFSNQQIDISFTRQDELLRSTVDGVMFFISIFRDKKELKDWYQMAEDFELADKPNPLDRISFQDRLAKKQIDSPNLYSDAHYSIARNIFEETSRLNLSKLYLFF